MKKLMIAASVAVCATVGFALESANIVGYANTDVTRGSRGAGYSFKSIGTEGTMADLQVTGYEGSYENGGITAVKLNTYGQNDGPTMIWVDADYGKDGVWYGWYDSEWSICYNDVSLKQGEGVWFKCDGNKQITSSGEVLQDTLPVTLIKGSQLAPNPTPITVKMGQVIIDGYGDTYENGGITAVKLNTYGQNDGDTMVWVDADYGKDGVWYGWYDTEWSGDYNTTVTLTPGESVWLKCPTAGWTVNWPNPITVAE